nr:NADH dehydrogenase subunit 4L [Acanthocheilonema viteae]
MVLFFLSFLFFLFKYDRLIFVMLSVEFLFFCLLSYYVFFFESMLFFYFICFGVVSGVVGLLIFFFSIKGFGVDKVMF